MDVRNAKIMIVEQIFHFGNFYGLDKLRGMGIVINSLTLT